MKCSLGAGDDRRVLDGSGGGLGLEEGVWGEGRDRDRTLRERGRGHSGVGRGGGGGGRSLYGPLHKITKLVIVLGDSRREGVRGDRGGGGGGGVEWR